MRNELLGTGTDGGLAGSAQAASNRSGEAFQSFDLMGGFLNLLQAELTWVVHDFIKGFGDIFTGLYNLVVGLFTDPEMVTEGINQLFSGLWSLFTGIGHLIIGVLASIPVLAGLLFTAVKNLFQGIWGAITQAAGNAWTAASEKIGGAINFLFNAIKNAILDKARNLPVIGGIVGKVFPKDQKGEPKYNGGGAGKMSLAQAIATEQKNKPAGSHLVIANSSETVIPAHKGYMAEPAFSGMIASMASGMGESNTTINFNPTIHANDMDADALANLMAEKVMAAVQEATYAEVYTS